MTARAPEPLTRAALGRRLGHPTPVPPVRIVHLGLGAFHRAHQAWYTARASDADDWGIAAFTGRHPAAAQVLAAQDGLYTVVERSESGERTSIGTAIVEAHDGADLTRLVELLAAPATAVVTMTVTEAGYHLTPDGLPDVGDPVMAADLEILRGAEGVPVSALGRLVLGLVARSHAGAGPIAVVPCDNVPSNGAFVGAGVRALAATVGPEFAAWVERSVSFVSTSVDRITPATTVDDLRSVAVETGWLDRAAVVTEPFSDWVLSGSFPAGRPDWESAGARFADDVEPFERRKLWLLNGAHSLLASLGALHGHATVAAAITDGACRAAVLEFWDEAVRHLDASGLELDAYRTRLLDRFANGRIQHRLAQIARDDLVKLRARIVPVARLERAAGRRAHGCARAVAAWIALAQTARGGAPVPDRAATTSRIAVLDDALADDPVFVETVHSFVGEYVAMNQEAS